MNMTTAPLIGQPVDRAEDRRFLTGAGMFVDDLKREGMLHAVILRSSVAHGRINGIDASAARARKGVRAVLTAAEIGASIPLIPLRLANLPEFASYLQPVIARDKVRYVGEPIAVVVAETRALAEDALDAIAVDIAPLPAVPDRMRRPAASRCCSKPAAATARCDTRYRRGMPTRLSSGPSTPAVRAFAVTA
jgi:carbon-monoxide dehydrogenase large subunit